MSCPDHKRYQAKRKPRAACEACWRMWIATVDAMTTYRPYVDRAPLSVSLTLKAQTHCVNGSYSCGGENGLCRQCFVEDAEMRRG